MSKTVFLFPGQGAQKVGMGQSFYDANPEVRALFNTAESILDKDIKSICFDGPDDVLKQTENAQPALFLVSASAALALKQEGITPDIVAGHSLGELTAYYHAGVLSLEDTLRLIKIRGEAMASSYPSEKSAMSAVMKVPLDTIEKIVGDCTNQPVVAANINSPGQVVISGTTEGVKEAGERLVEEGARLIPLNVSGAFHSPLMESASTQISNEIDRISFHSANCPILLNRTGDVEVDADALKENVALQVKSAVQWVKIQTLLGKEPYRIFEVGAGRVLTGLLKKTVSDKVCIPIGTMEDIMNIKGVAS